jgi:hypothetical protein
MTEQETIRLFCWECSAVYGSPKEKPQCPNCGWVPERQLVQLYDGAWADPACVIVGHRLLESK